MKLSRTVSYALQATLQLAQAADGAPVPSSRLAAEGKMPERFLLQILGTLVAKGILESIRGPDGGYMLERSPEQISLLELIEAIDGPISPVIPVNEGLCPESKDRLEVAIVELTAKSRRELAALKLAHLLPRSARVVVHSG